METHVLAESRLPPPARGREEIERKYLLDALPVMPEGAEVLRIEQGYLPDTAEQAERADQPPLEGRLRRTVYADGSVRMTHTVKVGRGVRRTESERTISADEFRRYWPHTEGRRLRKTRYRARGAETAASLVWEIDAFDDRDLVLAEVELPSPEAEVAFPAWLRPHVVREVTDDPSYRNYALAVGGSAGGPGRGCRGA
jgi:adenylate cyclase